MSQAVPRGPLLYGDRLLVPDERHVACVGEQRELGGEGVIQGALADPGLARDLGDFTQGKGANKIRVVVDNKSGNIITVTKG